MKKNFMTALVTLMAISMTSCLSIGYSNKDNTPTQVPQINQVTTMSPFTEVDIAGAFKIIYEQSDEYSVRIDAPEQAVKEMTVYVKDQELRIRQSVSKPTVSFKDVKIHITSPIIKDIELAGSGVFTASNRINSTDDIDIDVAGSGNVLLADVTCKDADLDIAGSGNIEIGHLAATVVNADIAGSGNINLGILACTKFDIDVAGSGDVTCNNITADRVHTDIAGSGNVTLKGSIKTHTQEIAGSGKVNIDTLKAEEQTIN